MKIDAYHNVISAPFLSDRSGLFHEGGLIQDSLLFRSYGQIVFPIETIPVPVLEHSGTYIYAGYLFHHFGHFLLESLSRIWFSALCPTTPIVWTAGKKAIKNPALMPWQMEVLAILGVRQQVLVTNEPCQFENLLIPKPGYVIRDKFEDFHVRAMGRFSAKGITSGKRVWLSRSGLKRNVITNEGEVENILREHGWIIFRPEQHSVSEQLAFISDAERLAGFEGSAFHMLILLNMVRARVDIFSRSGASVNENYRTIAVAKNFKQMEHQVHMSLVSRRELSVDYAIDDLSKVTGRLLACR